MQKKYILAGIVSSIFGVLSFLAGFFNVPVEMLGSLIALSGKCVSCTNEVLFLVNTAISLFIFLAGMFLFFYGFFRKKIESNWFLHRTKVFFAAFFLVIVFLASMALFREVDFDEFEHIHASWLVKEGFVPFKDFFEHHNSLLWYILSVFLIFLPQNFLAFYALRFVFFIFLLLMLFITYKISFQMTKDSETSFFSVFILATFVLFTEKAFEIRPDVPQTLFLLASAFLFLKFIETMQYPALVLSSFLAGLAFLFLQKAIVFFPLLILFACFGLKTKAIVKNALITAGSFFLPFLFYVVFLFFTGSLYEYFVFSWLLNIFSQDYLSPFFFLKQSLIQNSIYWIFFFLGVFFIAKNHKEASDKIKFVLASAGILLLSLFLFKVAYIQYFMPAIPFISIISSFSIKKTFDFFSHKRFLVEVLFLLLLFIPVIFMLRTASKTNFVTGQKVDYVLSNTSKYDYVYDPERQFNLFRKDLDFFWFSITFGLPTYKQLGFDYDYNVSKKIESLNPKIISTFYLDGISSEILQNYYSPGFNEILQKKS